jgi:hypothetical protein
MSRSQSYADRKRHKRPISIYLTPESSADLDALSERWGIISIRDVIATALRECANRPHQRTIVKGEKK